MHVDYLLAESVIHIKVKETYVRDRFVNNNEEQRASCDAEVSLGVRGDESAGKRGLELQDRWADSDLSVGLSEDGRLTSLSYKSTGVGSRVVAGTVKLLAFVAGLAARVAFAGGRPVAGERAAEEQAFAAWAEDNRAAANLLNGYREEVTALATELLTVRQEARSAATAADQAAELARGRRLEGLLAAARSEVDRLEAVYTAWRSAGIHTREATQALVLEMSDLPYRAWGDALEPAGLPPRSRDVWMTYNLAVQIESTYTPQRPQQDTRRGDSQRMLRWRLPRTVGVSIWRRTEAGLAVLERREQMPIVDSQSTITGLVLDKSLFGEHGAEVEFDERGAPVGIHATRVSAAGKIFDTLGAVPEGVAAGIESANKVSTAWTTLSDAAAEQRLAGLKRRLESAQKELELKGIAATEADHAKLKRLQQRVEIATAEGTLAPPSALDGLQAQLEQVNVERDLDAARRQAALDTELAELRAELARVQARVALADAQQEADGS